MSFNWNALDFADEYKAVAMDRRNRGLPTGKNAAGWQWKRQDAPKGSVDRLLSETKSKWEYARGEAIETYRASVFPERYQEFVPF